MKQEISIQSLKRLPLYLSHLKSLEPEDYPFISATTLAAMLDLNHVQVRKDLASVSTSGKPKVGYETSYLIYELEKYLGYKNTANAILVGAGHLGKALMSYKGFKEYGMEIVASFDNNLSVNEANIDGHLILPMEKMKNLCERLKINIGIITVPAKYAQEVCDQMVACGISAIWNFAPAYLRVPEHILVQNENVASSLALLSNHLKQQQKDIDL